MKRVTAVGGNFFKARADLARALADRRAEGCAVDDRTEEPAYGKFTRVMDLKGRRLERCQPPAGRFPG